jgi:hypothetical protein
MCALPSLSVLALARASDLGSAFVPKIYLVLRFMHDSPKLFWFHPASFISSSRASCAFEIHVTLLSNFRFRLRPVFCAQLAHLRARTHATPSNSMRQVSSQDFAREPGLSQQKRRKARPLQPSLHFQRRPSYQMPAEVRRIPLPPIFNVWHVRIGGAAGWGGVGWGGGRAGRRAGRQAGRQAGRRAFVYQFAQSKPIQSTLN